METKTFYIFIFVASTILIMALLSNGAVRSTPTESIVKSVVLEGLESSNSKQAPSDDLKLHANDLKLDEAFCNSKYSLVEIDKKCKTLSDKNCSLVNCCVFLNGEKCVGGSASGPTYLSVNGENVDVKYYRHKTNLVKSS